MATGREVNRDHCYRTRRRPRSGRTAGLTIVGTEANKIMIACPFCHSSDAGRVFPEGNFFCHSCQKTLNGFDLAKHVLFDPKAAVQAMVAVGLFQSYMSGNGHAAAPAPAVTPATTMPALSDQAAFLEVCRLKKIPPDSLRVFGGKPHRGGVLVPMFGPDAKLCSHIHITPTNGKGLYDSGKPTGLFFPCVGAKPPRPGET